MPSPEETAGPFPGEGDRLERSGYTTRLTVPV